MSIPLDATRTETRSFLIDENPGIAFQTNKAKTYLLSPTLESSNVSVLTASSKSLTNVMFQANITPTNALDSYIYVEFPSLEIGVKHNKATALKNATYVDFINTFNNFEAVALKSNALTNLLINGITVALNGKVVSGNLSTPKIMDFLTKINDSDELFKGYDMGKPDLYPLFTDYSRVNGNGIKPLMSEDGLISSPIVYDNRTPFLDSAISSTSSFANARKPMFRRSTTAPTTSMSYFIIDGLQLPIPLSIFSNNVESKSFYGINKLQISFQFDLANVDKMFSFLETVTGGGAGADQTIQPFDFQGLTLEALRDPILVYTQRAVNNDLMRNIKDSDGWIKNWETEFRDVVEYGQKAFTLQTIPLVPLSSDLAVNFVPIYIPSIQLSSLPEKLFIVVRKISSSKYPNMKYGFTPQVSALVNNLNIKLGGANSFVGSSVRQIALMNCRNGFQRVPYENQLYSHGNGMIIIDMQKDISVPSVNLLNTQTNISLDISFNVASLTLDTVTVAAVKVAYAEQYSVEVYGMSSRIVSFERGTITVNDMVAYLPNSSIANYLEQGNIAQRKTTSMLVGGASKPHYGGSFGSILANIGKAGIMHGPGLYKSGRDFLKTAITGSGGKGTNVIGGAKTTKGGASMDRVGFY